MKLQGLGLNLQIPAISNASESEKQTPAQSLRGLFTDDRIVYVMLACRQTVEHYFGRISRRRGGAHFQMKSLKT